MNVWPDLRGTVRRFIEQNFLLGEAGEPFSDDDSLIERHVLDSTGFLELVGFLETTFDIHVEDLEMIPENLDSLASIEAYVSAKRSQPQPAREFGSSPK